MHIVQALLKGFIGCLVLVVLFLLLSYLIKPPEPAKYTTAPITKIRLNQQNVVDLLVEHINTEGLHAVQFIDRVLKIELELQAEEDVDQMIYKLTPGYVTLAFDYSDNVEELVVEYMLVDDKHNVKINYMDLKIKVEDAWLTDDRKIWLNSPWLEHSLWRELLRIQYYYKRNDNQIVMGQ